jgi:hypothetical protein
MLSRLGYLLMVLAVLWVRPASAVFYTYSEWAALSEVQRAFYISGAYDSLTSFADTPEGARGAVHYQTCVAKSGMTNSQLAAKILNYAKDKPALHTLPATHAMLDYLIAACGLPPKPEPK